MEEEQDLLLRSQVPRDARPNQSGWHCGSYSTSMAIAQLASLAASIPVTRQSPVAHKPPLCLQVRSIKRSLCTDHQQAQAARSDNSGPEASPALPSPEGTSH
eukprot:3816854-Amphidinium_carterae.1